MLHVPQKPDFGFSTYKSFPKMITIAPAPERKHLTLDLQTPDRRKYNNKANPYTGAQAASIARRNARERNRVKQVNDGFNALRKRLPAAVVAALSGGSRRGSGKKLSKVDTLKMVVEYIRHLETLIDDSDGSLETTRESTQNTEAYEMNEDIFEDREESPYSNSVPSPNSSECSSGVSSGYCVNYNNYSSYQLNEEQMTPVDEDELLNAISWWQDK